jgi:helix-turn-helix protein
LFDIGGSLAAARKGQGLTFPDAEQLTCLRARYLAALENEDFELLPGRAYARAFLRTYADALSLDADRFVDEFDARYPAAAEEPPPAVIRPRRRVPPSPALAAAGVLLAIAVAVVVWSALSRQPKLTPAPELAAARAAQAPTHRRVALAGPVVPVVHRRAPLVVEATSGPCWLLVRRGGPAGPVLFEGTLAQGRALRFAARVWMRLGAPWNVALHRGAKHVGGLSASTPVNLSA